MRRVCGGGKNEVSFEGWYALTKLDFYYREKYNLFKLKPSFRHEGIDLILKKLTVKDIAREVGVSTATISRVLNNSGYVSEQVREQVTQAIEKLNYQPNSIARSLKQKKTRSVGIVLPDMTNPYFMSIARQIQRKLMSAGYHLLFMDSEEDPAKEKQAFDFLMEKRVEALIVAGTGANKDKLEAVQSSGIHVVLIDRMIAGLAADIIAQDNRSVSEAAMTFLLEKGHRYIGMINGPSDVVTARDRYEGGLAAFAKKGLTIDPRYVYQGDFTRRSGMKAIAYFMQLLPWPTAIFSVNNEMSYGLYLGLHELGIRSDLLEVVSFGDLEFSPLFQNKLSVIKQNPEKIGDTAGELVLERLEKPKKEFIIRMLSPLFVPKT